jgi:hypothetical protein
MATEGIARTLWQVLEKERFLGCIPIAFARLGDAIEAGRFDLGVNSGDLTAKNDRPVSFSIVTQILDFPFKRF